MADKNDTPKEKGGKKYIGPKYKRGIIINDELIKPESMSPEEVDQLLKRVPAATKYFK